MRGFGILALIGVVLLALIAGGIGFGMGAAQVAPAAAGSVVYPAVGWHWFGFGFPFFGLIFGLLFLFLIFGLVRRAIWGGRGWHGYGHGYGPGYGPRSFGPGGRQGWDGTTVPPFVDEMLKNWHRQAHGEDTPATDPTQK
ncbi:MAG TPA: hypothetical protein VIK00_03050 [Candidatus Limnocylindrales bacterium]